VQAKPGVEPTSSMRAIAAVNPIKVVRVIEHDLCKPYVVCEPPEQCEPAIV